MARVLIVDDEESDRLMLQSALEGEHELHLASSGGEALELYRRLPIDVVVTDIQMPGGDGLELIGAIKKLDATAAIVAISGQKPHKLGIAQMAGASSILSKPISPQRLKEAVVHALARARGEG